MAQDIFKNKLDSEERFDIKISETNDVSKKAVFLSKYFKIILFLEIIIVLSVGYFILIKPELKIFTDNKSIIKQKQKIVEDLNKLEIKMNGLQQKRDNVISQGNTYSQKLSEILPQNQDLPQIISQVQALADSFGLVLGNISISAPQETVNFSDNTSSSTLKNNNEIPIPQTQNSSNNLIKEVDVTVFILGADGSYDKVKQFLGAIEQHRRLFDVTSFSFDSKMTTYSIIFKTYYLENAK